MWALDDLKTKGHIGIGGGAGRMGQWGLSLLRRLGYQNLHLYDLNQEKNTVDGVEIHDSAKSLAEKVDMLIVSVAPAATLGFIQEVGGYLHEGALFSDFTSKKEKTTAEMAKFEKVDVIGIHPNFKNTERDLIGQNIILTPVEGRSESWLETIIEMFRETDANIRIVSPKIHDVVSDFNQGGIHLAFLVMGGLMRAYCKEYHIEPSDLFYLDTPNSKIMQTFMGRFYGTRNPAVAWGIQNMTPYVKDVRRLFMKETEKVFRILESGDQDAFNSFFFKNAAAFGDANLQTADEDSTKVVALLKGLGYEAKFRVVVDETKAFLDKELYFKADKLGVFEYVNRDPFRPPEKEVDSHKSAYDRELESAGRLYARMELYFKRGEFTKSREAAVDLKHNITRRLRTQIERFAYNDIPLCKGFEEGVSTYIGMCDKVISYQKSTTPTVVQNGFNRKK